MAKTESLEKYIIILLAEFPSIFEFYPNKGQVYWLILKGSL